jgi:hypothetical protein
MNRPVLEELLAMQARDMETRSRLLAEGRLYGDYDEEMQRVHRENAGRLDGIVARHGWPGISLVGIEGGRAAWLIAQHSICTPDLQRKFLALLARACESGEAPKKQWAYLTDRIRSNENRPQVYGTVLDWNSEGELSCDVEAPGNVDARRKAAGLPPFEEDLRRRREEAESEGGRAPDNYAEYKRRQAEWARKVGWL